MGGKQYFRRMGELMRSGVIDRAAMLAADALDTQNDSMESIGRAAALYAAVAALESRHPALMITAKKVFEELVENAELREGGNPGPEH